MEGTAKERDSQSQDPGSTESHEGSQNPESGQQDPSGSESQTGSPQGGAESGGSQGDGFRDPMLRGKSPQEIEETFRLMKQANAEQGQMLSRLQQQNTQPRGPDGGRPPQQQDDEDFDDIDFFDDPDKKLKQFQNRMGQMIHEAIEPFKQNLETQAASTVRGQLREKYDDFAKFEPVIDTLLRQMEVEPSRATPQQLEQLYFTAVGYANKKGIQGYAQGARNEGGQNVSGQQNNQQEEGNQPPVNPPNRRPSGTPPAPKGNKEQTRELTESERALARQFNMTPEEFVEWQDKPQDEVVKPGYSMEGR